MINTVTGQITPDQLGPTLMHEHLMVGSIGWEADTIRPGPSLTEIRALCLEKVQQLQARGIKSMVDASPNDLGRNVEFMADVAQATGLQIICATGLYNEHEGGSAYWKFRARLGGVVEDMAQLFIKELTEGIGSTGIRAGIIKVATGVNEISPYERDILRAAAIASKETGAPITTHTTEGQLGDRQQALLVGEGVPANRIIIGHSCGSADHDYHMRIVDGGSYIGFDRIGIVALMPDEERAKCIMKLIARGKLEQIIVSHDSVWCWRGGQIPSPEIKAYMDSMMNPCHFHDDFGPLLKSMGADDRQIETLLVANPRRFFSKADREQPLESRKEPTRCQ
jgi:phosphotriesterase-related protein